MQLLRFQWGNKEYGVSVEDVIGITGKSWVNGLKNTEAVEKIINLQGTPITIFGIQKDFASEDKKHAIIMNANGVQIALIVDSVIKITSLRGEVIPGAIKSSFNIWHFVNQHDQAESSEDSEQ